MSLGGPKSMRKADGLSLIYLFIHSFLIFKDTFTVTLIGRFLGHTEKVSEDPLRLKSTQFYQLKETTVNHLLGFPSSGI
jgi:hypothetical protein